MNHLRKWLSNTATVFYTEEPDPISGLTSKEKKVLLRCWETIQRDLHTQSIKLFVRFLRVHPHYRRYFQSLSDRPKTRLAADARVQTHFRSILTSVGSLVTTAASRPHNLTPKYDFLALIHLNLGLSYQDFFNFRDELIEYLSSEFPDEMTSVCRVAWHTLLTNAFIAVCQRIDAMSRMADSMCSVDSDEGCSSIGSLYWEHRRTFWKTQRELWGERTEEDLETDDDREEDDEEYGSRAGSRRRRESRYLPSWLLCCASGAAAAAAAESESFGPSTSDENKWMRY